LGKPIASCTSTQQSAAAWVAVAKGVRRTKSRFGGRLEPLSHVELMLHQGSGELQTVTGADLRASHPRVA
jgi:DNA repair protein RecO (recombination protein O)